MDALNKWLTDTLGAWTLDFYGLFLIIAAALAIILIIVLIAVAVCHAKNKKKIKSLKAQAEQNGVSPSENADGADVSAYEAQIAALNDALLEKQNRIDELAAMNSQRPASENDVNDLYRTINELNETNKEQANEINLLKAENAQIKAQALQQRIAATSSETTAADDAPDDEDEYDEYYDDYGDENSAVKVTLKFDRTRNNWIILRSDTDRTYRRLATKQEALVIAKDLARRLHAQLVVHKKDGKFQRV